MEDGERRANQEADDTARRFVRLDAREIYARSAAVPRGDGSVSAAVSRRIDLPRTLHGQLVPALPDGVERPRNGTRTARRKIVVHPLSRRRVERNDYGRDDAPRNDAGRHGYRRASGR